jgi:ribosomal protein L6P/L9E
MCFPVGSKYHNNRLTFCVYIPPIWDVVVYKSLKNNFRVFFCFNETYFFRFSFRINLASTHYDVNSSVASISSVYTNNFFRLYFTELTQVFASFHRPFFKKVKFRGKGYYIYKNKRNTITPQFGYSHRLYLYAYFSSVVFLSKTSVFVFGLVREDVISTCFGVKNMRPINIFTGRGVRFARQIIYKKVGKVSSYR